MDNSSVKQGGDLMLFAKIDGKIKTIAFATSHKLSISTDMQENTNKDHGGGQWKSSTVKKFSWNVSSENLFIEKNSTAGENQAAFGDLFDLMVLKTEIDVMMAPIVTNDNADIPSSGWVNEATGTYSGKAIITSLEMNAPSGDNATYSVQMEGVSKLEHDKPIVAGVAQTHSASAKA